MPGYTVPSKGWTFYVKFNTRTVIQAARVKRR